MCMEGGPRCSPLKWLKGDTSTIACHEDSLIARLPFVPLWWILWMSFMWTIFLGSFVVLQGGATFRGYSQKFEEQWAAPT